VGGVCGEARGGTEHQRQTESEQGKKTTHGRVREGVPEGTVDGTKIGIGL
jgi:hypothetical protein